MFSPSVCKFIAKRDYENHNSGILAWVTSFTGEDTLGLVELNEFVFGANPRVDILHRVVVWQRAKRRAVSKLEYWFTCNIVGSSRFSAFHSYMSRVELLDEPLVIAQGCYQENSFILFTVNPGLKLTRI